MCKAIKNLSQSLKIYGRSGRHKNNKAIVIIAIPLILSAFTHIWNPIGFPSIYIDESHYMRRAVQVLQGMGPQESGSVYVYPYDHPYFGQLFLATMLKLIGYPTVILNQFSSSSSSSSLFCSYYYN